MTLLNLMVEQHLAPLMKAAGVRKSGHTFRLTPVTEIRPSWGLPFSSAGWLRVGGWSYGLNCGLC